DVDGVRKHTVAAAVTKVPAAKILPGAIPFETARRHLHFGSARVRLIAVVFAVRSPGASYDAKTACRPACTSSNAITFRCLVHGAGGARRRAETGQRKLSDPIGRSGHSALHPQQASGRGDELHSRQDPPL